jgi:hypothetical protein
MFIPEIIHAYADAEYGTKKTSLSPVKDQNIGGDLETRTPELLLAKQ